MALTIVMVKNASVYHIISKFIQFTYLVFSKECGLVYSTPNSLKIYGGMNAGKLKCYLEIPIYQSNFNFYKLKVAYSWPSIVYVQIRYTGTHFISGVGNVNIDTTFSCGGSLIDRQTGNLKKILLHFMKLKLLKKKL